MKRICPVCGNSESHFIQQIHMIMPPEMPLPNQYDLVSCQRCGFCYGDTAAKQSDYDIYYSTYNNYSGQGENHTFHITFSVILDFLKEKVDKDSRMMDIGFGKGQLLTQLYSLGYTNLFGIDPSLHSVTHLQERGITAYQRSIFDSTIELDQTVDIAFFMSVVEHLLDPKGAISSAAKYLKPGGYLVVDIPDYSYCDQMMLPMPNCFNQEHINYFSEESFATMLIGTEMTLLYSVPVTLPTGGDMGEEYSRIFFLQKTQEEKTMDIRKDCRTEGAIKKYLERQKNKRGEVYAVISALCKRKAPVAIWGTGAMTMSLLAETDLMQCNIVALVDGNPLKHGIELAGKTILSPEHLRDFPDAEIVISAMHCAAEIRESIIAMKLPNKVIILNF